jgi:hypothetical protein
MLSFPSKAAVNVKIPKKSFYENLLVSTANKRIFIDQINAIYWRYKLTAESLGVSESDTIDEIEVFEIELLTKDFDSGILRLIDKGIPYHTVFILTYNDECQLWIAYKEKTSGDTLSVGGYYHTDFAPSESVNLSAEGLSLDEVYANLFYAVSGLQKDCSRPLKDVIIEHEKRQKLEKEIARLENQMRKETQPKKKFELHQKINNLKEKINNG